MARRALLYDVLAAFVGLALLALLQNVDVLILGRQAGNSNVIGSYAAISVASKALVFGALALGSYLLPEATIRWNEGGHALRQLGVTLLFLAVPAVLLLGVSIVIPKQFITLFFSAKLATAASAFAPLVAAMIFLAISVLLTNYLFGAGRRWIVIVLAVGAALSVVLVAGAHGSPEHTAKADLIVQAGWHWVSGASLSRYIGGTTVSASRRGMFRHEARNGHNQTRNSHNQVVLSLSQRNIG